MLNCYRLWLLVKECRDKKRDMIAGDRALMVRHLMECPGCAKKYDPNGGEHE